MPTEGWDDFTFDYAFSFTVFQYIEDFTIIENYIKKISSSLKWGVAQFHFDTRKPKLLYRLPESYAGLALLETQRRGIRRYRRECKSLLRLFGKHDLEIVRGMTQNSGEHIFIL